jgi:hypothetical protein
MTLQQLIDKWNGNFIDFDHSFGPQCVDLMRQYIQDVLGKSQIPGALYAKDIFKNFQSTKDFTKIINNPKDLNQFPKAGDIIFWGAPMGLIWVKVGFIKLPVYAGHVAVCTGGNGYKFISFDQNFGGNGACKYVNHDYRGVLGWLHPNK